VPRVRLVPRVTRPSTSTIERRLSALLVDDRARHRLCGPQQGALASASPPPSPAAGVGFVIHQRRRTLPLYDLDTASRRVFWVAACAGIIVLTH
jgi:hypothetical protein